MEDLCYRLRVISLFFIWNLAFGEAQIFDRVEDQMIYFKSASRSSTQPKPLKTNLFDLSYLGELKPVTGEPYLFFTGKDCQSCIDPKSIYVLRPNGGPPLSFVLPGRILDPKTHHLLMESRAFIGKCLRNRGEIFVIFQKEHVDRRKKLQPSVLVEEAGPSFLQETLLESRLPPIDQTLALVRKKLCQEIPGAHRLMLSKPLDLRPPPDKDTEEP